MKFEFKNGLIWIPVFLEYEGKQISIEKCILDTGSATTAFDINFVDFNYHKPSFSFERKISILQDKKGLYL